MKNALLITACALATLFSACKKENNEIRTLVKTQEQGGYTTTFEYNNNGQIVKMADDYGNVSTYTYGSNKVNVTYINSPTNSGLDNNGVFQLRSDGKVELLIRDVSGTTSFTYNSDGLFQEIVSPWDVTVYEWVNGNIVKETRTTATDTTISTFTYYTDKDNYLNSSNFGITWNSSSKNLLKTRNTSYSSSEVFTEYNYEFDDKGRVVARLEKMNGVNSPAESMLKYTYY